MFKFFKSKSKANPKSELRILIESIHSQERWIYSPNDIKDLEEYKQLKSLSTEETKALVTKLFDLFLKLKRGGPYPNLTYQYGKDDNEYEFYADRIIGVLISGMQRKKLNYSEAEWIATFDKMKEIRIEFKRNIESFSINYFIKQIEYYLKDNPLTEHLKQYIKRILEWQKLVEDVGRNYRDSDLPKAVKKLEAIIQDPNESSNFLLESNDIGEDVNDIIAKISKEELSYDKIFVLASKVSGSKPNAKFLKELDTNMQVIGIEHYRKTVHQILKVPVDYKFVTESNENSSFAVTSYLSNLNQIFIKGIVWTCDKFSDKETIQLLSKLAVKSYVKLPYHGPAATSLGNACVNVLGNMRGKDGLGALSMIKLKVRQNNVKKTINKFLIAGAKKYNVSVEELKEMAVPEYGLKNGSKEISFEDYKLNIIIQESKVSQLWIKPDGSQMKSVPSIIKNNDPLKKKLQTQRKEIKEIQKTYSAQKQRIDNQLILDRTWDFTSFKKYYIDHGLVYPISSKLIWSFAKNEKSTDAILINDEWRSIENENLDWIDDETSVQLWHPVKTKVNEVVAWRKKIMDLEWKQPIKQAYREIYLLTEAEENTKTYSNRMASHILKQHQFSSLANIRNWKYSLMGWYDDGRYNEICSKELPEHNMSAEFWIDEVNQDDAFNDAGIWHYVSTDQVKFKNADGETLDLDKVPILVFSEVMRDVDLFVGVSSVGNDPQWIDNSGERQTYRDYWHSYSFGDLTEIAKTRKEILENLLPKLTKIKDRARIEGKFLIIQGQLKTYKIHIGSGNILMEPNDQYLCIVPSRSSSKTDKLFIPFEGDRGLSIVLSKAFLLAEDQKIDDATILSQIK